MVSTVPYRYLLSGIECRYGTSGVPISHLVSNHQYTDTETDTIGTFKYRTNVSNPDPHLVCSPGSVSESSFEISIQSRIGKSDSDPGAIKLTKIK